MHIKCLFFMLMMLLLAQQKTSYSRDQKSRHTDNKDNRIKPYHKNASYWQYKGLPVFLLGGNRLVNPYQLEQHELLNYLDELQSSGGNYFRNVMSDREPGNVKAFKRLNDGRYDLTQWNEDYWDGLRRMLKWSYERDMIVNLTFWDRFDHYDQIGHRDTSRAVLWVNSPWNPVNNVNYTIRESGLDSTYVGHPITGINPFHQSMPGMKNLQVVLHFQQKFIEKILDLSLAYDNVIYNMGNEHQLDLMQWDKYWVQFVRDYALAKGREIETTAMFDHVIDSDGEWARVNGFSPVIESNDLFTFIEGSKVGSQWTDPGEAQYEAAIELINHAAEYEKRPVNAVKVRTQNIVHNPQERLWRLLMAGFAALSHHRDYLEGLTPDGWPIGGLALTEMAKTNIQAMRIFTDLIIPWESVPRQDLLSGREDDEAYLMAKEGSMYGLYFPKGSGSIGLDLQNFQRPFIMRWVDIGKGQVILETEVKGGSIITIETPYDVEFGWACAITVINGVTVTDFDKMQRTKHEIKQQDSKALTFYNRLIANADNALTEGPFSVTNKTGVPPSGSKHDYMTLAPYFWPNPDTPDGLPYIRKDGEVNPETRDDYTDYIELRRFFSAVDVLGEAFYYSGDKKFADKAISLIRAWFIDPATKMNPHLNYGQGIPGHVEGRPFGIIEFGGIRNVLSTMEILKHKNSMDAETEEGVSIWLSEYSNWLQTSELGVLESTRSNNHGTTYDGQLYNILLYLGEIDQVRRLMETVTINRINDHIEPDGSQPHELDRTRSHSYSITNLSAHTRLAVLGKKVGVDLWNYESPDGGSIKKAYEFLIQYLVTDKEWEYQQISSLSASKIRFANLLLDAGKEFDEVEFEEIAQEYLRLSQVTSDKESSLRTDGQNCCNPARTFFQNDWDGNDRDNRYVARDWEKYNLGRFATALTDPKNLNSAPASVTVKSFEEGGRLVAAATLTGNVDLIMGGGSGQMLALVKEVLKQGGDLSNILVIDHSPSNRNNVEGRAGQYPPFDTAWDELNELVRTKTLPNQNHHAYGWLDSSGQENRPKTDDVSDLGMLHYVCFGEEEPGSQKLFEKDVKHCQISPALTAPTGLTTEYHE